MILRIKPLVLSSGSGCDIVTSGADEDNIFIKITHKGNTICNCTPLDIRVSYSNLISGYFIDNDGVAIPYELSVEAEPSSGVSVYLPKLDITFRNVWNYIDLTIELYKTVGLAIYSNVFRIYGYDLGVNADVAASQYNDKFEILVDDTLTLPYFISYRKPFTNQIHLYNACGYLDIGSSYVVNNTVISTLQNVDICSSDVTSITKYNSAECSKTNIVKKIQWIPTWEVTKTCDSCDDGQGGVVAGCECECVDIYNPQGVITQIDFSTIGVTDELGVYIAGIMCDDIRIFSFISLGIRYSLYDSNAILVPGSEQISVFNLPSWEYVNPSGYVAADYVYTVISPATGAYQLTTCLEILGIPEYIKAGNLVENEYYQIQCSLDATYTNTPTEVAYDESSFIAVSSIATDTIQNVFIADIVNASPNITPTWDIYGNVILVLTDYHDIQLGHYYMITDLKDVAFDLVVLPVGTTPIVGHCFVGTDYPFECRYITEVTPVITCCKNIIIEGCQPYTVTQNECDSFTICNTSPDYVLSYVVKLFNGTSFVAITSGTGRLAAFTGATPNCISFSDLPEGVYDIELSLTINEVAVTTHTYIFSICSILDCKLAYLKKLICCNPETNCDSACDDCSKKNYYDFNAFSMIMQSYFTAVNHIYSFGYYYTMDNATYEDILANISAVYNLLEQAGRYCMTCDEPCKEC